MNLYAESSAVLSWLLGETAGATIRKHLKEADAVMTSRLTLVECHRAIARAVTLERFSGDQANKLRIRLNGSARYWNILALAPAILDRACQAFPGEPLRTLDAVHVASALHGRAAGIELEILSLDTRVRAACTGLGFALLPPVA